jgi:PDZ domain-containing protein
MQSSQQNAAVVAERALGKVVEIRQLAKIGAFGPDSPAQRAGLREGDEIIEARGRPVRALDDLRRALEGVRPGERVTLRYRRGDARRTVDVPTAPNPEDPKRAVLGVVIAPAEAKLPIPVTYATQGVGGPSAGLGFALEIYSALSRRPVVRGHRVAVTGEIFLDGTVAPIGGIKQKTFGAADAGADVFLVPEENAAEARRWAKNGLRIVPVGTFAEALDALSALPAA